MCVHHYIRMLRGAQGTRRYLVCSFPTFRFFAVIDTGSHADGGLREAHRACQTGSHGYYTKMENVFNNKTNSQNSTWYMHSRWCIAPLLHLCMVRCCSMVCSIGSDQFGISSAWYAVAQWYVVSDQISSDQLCMVRCCAVVCSIGSDQFGSAQLGQNGVPPYGM